MLHWVHPAVGPCAHLKCDYLCDVKYFNTIIMNYYGSNQAFLMCSEEAFTFIGCFFSCAIPQCCIYTIFFMDVRRVWNPLLLMYFLVVLFILHSDPSLCIRNAL